MAPPPDQQKIGPRLRTTVWLICLMGAFAATHSPPPAKPAPMIFNDKFLHFMGFCALGIVTVWRASGRRSTFTLSSFARWLAFLCVYGAFDEASQRFVGRDSELGDWIANALGALTGMVICVLCLRTSQAAAK